MSDAFWRPRGDVLARIACVMIALSATPGCGLFCGPVACPASGRLEIAVVNDQTGAPICDARVTATIDGFVEELPASGGCSSRTKGRGRARWLLAAALAWPGSGCGSLLGERETAS